MEDVKSSGGISDTRPARKGGKKGKRTAAAGVYAKGGTYVVKSGDYPAKIAKKFGVSVSALLEANKMTMDDAKKLQIGQKLTIPAKGAAKGKKVNKKPAGKTEVKVEAGVYVVRSGDVPARIARRLKVKLADLLKANNMTLEDAKKLQIGQKLVVPGKGVQKQEVAQKDVTTEKKTKQDAQKQEVKEKNEDLDSADQIAKKIEENPADDKNKNNFDDGGEPYELAEDTTFQELAVKLNVPEAKLRSMNTEFTGDNLSKGSCVMIPSKK
jgi:LysM repeat protein